MPLKLFAAMNIIGRKAETEATLKSLMLSDIAPETALFLMVCDTPELKYDDVVNILNGNQFHSVEMEYVQRIPYERQYRHALEVFKNTEAEYFAMFDNDVILNPDWFSVLMQTKETAEYEGNKVGVLNPINVPHGAYQPQVKQSYIIKRRMAGTVQVIPRQAALELPTEKTATLWNRSPKDWAICDYLFNKGYIHCCPIISTAQHIGKKGNGMSERSWIKRGKGGEGFRPHESIMQLWSLFNA